MPVYADKGYSSPPGGDRQHRAVKVGTVNYYPQVYNPPPTTESNVAVSQPAPKTSTAPPIVNVKESRSFNFNWIALGIIALGAFVILVGVRGSYKNIISLFTPLNATQVAQSDTGLLGTGQLPTNAKAKCARKDPHQQCPSGTVEIDLFNGPQCCSIG